MIARSRRYRASINRSSGPTTAELFEGAKADYQAAKPSRFKRVRHGLLPYGSNADWNTRNDVDYYTILEQVRDMDRNDVFIGQLVTRAAVNTLQEGMIPDPQTGDKEIDADLRERWADWACDPNQCDVRGEATFEQLEYLALRQTLVDGDTLALLLKSGHMQMVEGHRCRRPLSTRLDVVHGVLLDDNRKPLEYWLTKDEISPLQQVNLVSDIRKYPARDAEGHRIVCHVLDPTRVTQTRGFSALVPCVDVAGMFEDANFAMIVKAQVASCYTIFRERSAEFEGRDNTPTGADQNDPAGDGSSRTVEGISPGMEVTGQPGEKLQGFSPAIPNPEFFQHVKLMLTLVSINLGTPLVVSLLDASETNFSGFRGAVDQARMGYRRNQKWLIQRFHEPAYRWKVRQWMIDDPALRAAAKRSDVRILRHRWNRPAWPYIEPLKDASADLMRVRNALISPRRLQAERGRDWPTQVREIVEDNMLAITAAKKAAKRVNARFKDDDPVHWRELISLPTPDGVKVTVTADGGGGEGGSQNPKTPPANGGQNA